MVPPVRPRADERIPETFAYPRSNCTASRVRSRHLETSRVRCHVATYEALADARNKGKICTRSGSHPYNLSLVAALIAHNGEAKTEAWAKGVVANMARTPRGGDSDQIKAVAAGECAIALSNTYYYGG